MANKFDHKSLARSITKLLDAAQSNIERPGASIATQRLIDYSSGEFGKLTSKQAVKVLGAIDKKFKKNLLRDGDGSIIGYVYSGKIFVSLKDNQTTLKKDKGGKKDDAGGQQGGGQEDFAAKYAAQYMQGGDDKDDKGGKKKSSKKKGQGGQEDFVSKYAGAYVKGGDTKTKKKSGKK